MCLRNHERGENMFSGDSDTQNLAIDALPILVRCAKQRQTITFWGLRQELKLWGKYYNALMCKVFKHIETTLAELEMEDDWKGEIPHITSIVLKANGRCSPNMCEALTGDRQQQPSPEQLQAELNCSFDYEKWDAVLAALFLPRQDRYVS